MSRAGRDGLTSWVVAVVPLTAGAWSLAGGVAATLTFLAALVATIIALTYHEETRMPRPTNPSPTDAANLRRAADRLVALGVLKSWAFDREESPRTLTVRTAADDVVEVPRRDAPALLRGIGLGSWAVSHG